MAAKDQILSRSSVARFENCGNEVGDGCVAMAGSSCLGKLEGEDEEKDEDEDEKRPLRAVPAAVMRSIFAAHAMQLVVFDGSEFG